MKAIGKIGTREFFAIVVLAIGTKLSDLTPTIYAQTGKNGYWLMPIVSFIFIFPSVLLLLYLLERYKNLNLVDLIHHILGQRIGRVFSLLFFFIAFIALSIDSRNYIDTLSTMYFEESPEISLYLVFMLVCAFGAKKGFETIGSTSWAVLPYIKVSILLLVLIAMKDVVWLRIFPIFGEGFKELIIEGAKKGSVFGDLFFLAMAFPVLKDKKSFCLGYFGGSVFVLVEMTLFFLVYCTFFDYKSITKIAFPFHEITQYINLGTYFTNIETFFMTFWLLAAFLRFIIYLYITTWIFGSIFKIKEFEPLTIIMGVISITAGMIPDGPIYNTMILRSNFLNFTTFFLVIFPMILWIVAKFKGELKKS